MTKERIKLLVSIALPIAIQNLINFAVNLLDTVMLGQLGEMPLAASSLANQVFFIVTLVVYGIGGGANVLTAQFWGRKDTRSIYKILTYTYRTAAGFALFVSAGAVIIPQWIMRMFTHDEVVIAMGIEYLRIVGWSYLLFTATTVTLCILRAVRIVKIAMILSCVSLSVNVILNYILIFGKFGAPALGIKGAAIATLSARAAEFLLLVYFLYKKEKVLFLWKYFLGIVRRRDDRSELAEGVPEELSDMASEEKSGQSLWKLYLSISVPVIINELFWALGESAVSMILGRMGTEIVSANAIYANISELSGVVVSGMNSAACVIIGNLIGSGKKRELYEHKKLFQGVSVAAGLLGLIIMLGCRGFVIDFYKVTSVTKMYAGQIMLIGSVVELCRSIQTMNMMGLLRGIGDVKFAMFNDLLFLWFFTIPLGILTGLVWKWPVAAVYVALKLDQCLKIFTSEYRLRKKIRVEKESVQESA